MRRGRIWLGVIAVPVGVVLAAILGGLAYIDATTTPVHPDPRQMRSVSRSVPSPEWAGAVAQARQLVRASIVAQNLPGLSVAVGVDGRIVWAEGFGWADVENRVPVTPGTRFRAADASKALTSAAVGLLVQEGRLRLDERIQAYVPEFPEKAWPVTLRHLMAQVGGITTDRGGEAQLSADTVDEEARLIARCRRTVDGLQLDQFAERDLLFQPGTAYRPSSYGWVLVSAAIEAAAQEPFFSFMAARVFAPLGMRDTRVDVSTEAIADRATVYFPRFDVIGRLAGSLASHELPTTRFGPQRTREGDYSCYAGAGAFLSTPADLVRFGMAAGGTLLRPDTLRLLQTPQRLASGEATGYGLGWELETLPLGGRPARMAGHGSRADFIGATASFMTFPERGLAVSVMANISLADTRSVALAVAQGFASQPAAAAIP